MKRHLALSALLLAAAFAGAAAAQVVGYNFRTGDLWMDTQLGYISDYGVRDRAYFVDDLVESYGAPRYLVNDLLDKRHWSPGDVYYASALAYTARRPLGDVTREYEGSKGQGWGVVAQRMGIKPGSAEFHALKGHMGKSKGRYESRGPGHGNKGDRGDQGGQGDKGEKGRKGDMGEKGDKGDHGDKGNGKGKGNSKGHGH